MPRLATELSKEIVKNLPTPSAGYVIHLCPVTTGLGVRVSASGSKAFVLDIRHGGKSYRRTLGDAEGKAALTIKEAIRAAGRVRADIEKGEDILVVQKATKAAVEAAVEINGPTLADAITEYVSSKKRAKDGLSLKERTKSDYLAMVAKPYTLTNGKMSNGGSLYLLSDKPLNLITEQDIRDVYALQSAKGQRQADYMMQVLRALFNWFGVGTVKSVLNAVAGKDKITILPTKARKNPMNPKHIGAWWQAATNSDQTDAANYYRFQLLTGCRGVEIMGDDFGNEPILVKNVNQREHSITISNTKNRRDHTIYLSRQAMEIIEAQIKGKKLNDLIFPVGDPRKTLRSINKVAGLDADAYSGHDFRATFASIAAMLCSSYAVDAMTNHIAKDVVSTNYLQLGSDHLRDGWQKVADFVSRSI